MRVYLSWLQKIRPQIQKYKWHYWEINTFYITLTTYNLKADTTYQIMYMWSIKSRDKNAAVDRIRAFFFSSISGIFAEQGDIKILFLILNLSYGISFLFPRHKILTSLKHIILSFTLTALDIICVSVKVSFSFGKPSLR